MIAAPVLRQGQVAVRSGSKLIELRQPVLIASGTLAVIGA